MPKKDMGEKVVLADESIFWRCFEMYRFLKMLVFDTLKL